MAQRISRSDRLFEWPIGVDVQLAIKNFQKCVANTQVTEFGGSSPDIGGIGVIISLTVIFGSCTIGSLIVMALGFILNGKDHDDSRTRRALKRIFIAISHPLIFFLDTALFISITMAIAAVTWTGKIHDAEFKASNGRKLSKGRSARDLEG
ncbi:hypothetical protein FPQ18DRAFT_305426 [Pyronema domesticum]|nr:hypothetical protein FPQ18DRAFT_305426 [Pyronema domesticum]